MVRFDNSSVSSNYVAGNYPMPKGKKDEKEGTIFTTNESQNIDLQKAFTNNSGINTEYLKQFGEDGIKLIEILNTYTNDNGEISNMIGNKLNNFLEQFGEDKTINTLEEKELLDISHQAIVFKKEAQENFQEGIATYSFGSYDENNNYVPFAAGFTNSSTINYNPKYSETPFVPMAIDLHGKFAIRHVLNYAEKSINNDSLEDIAPSNLKTSMENGHTIRSSNLNSNYSTARVHIMQPDGSLKEEVALTAYNYTSHYEHIQYGPFATKVHIPINNPKAQVNEAKTSLNAKNATVTYEREVPKSMEDIRAEEPSLFENKHNGFISGEFTSFTGKSVVDQEFKELEVNKSLQAIMNNYIEHTSAKKEKQFFVINEIPEGVTGIKLSHVDNEYTMTFNYDDNDYTMNVQIPDKK